MRERNDAVERGLGKGLEIVEPGAVGAGLVGAILGKGEAVVMVIDGVERVRLEGVACPEVGFGGAQAMLEAVAGELDLCFELDGVAGVGVSA